MAKRRATDREVAYLAAEHQANLLLLSASWAAELLDFLKPTDRELLGTLGELLEEAGSYSYSAKVVAQYRELQRQVLLLRLKSYRNSLEYLIRQSEALAENEAKWAASMTRATLQGQALQALDAKTVRAIVKYGFVDNGKTIEESLTAASEDDARRVTEACKAGVAQGKTTEQIVKEIRGTKEGNYEDGILEVSRKDAMRIARTTCTGIADEAKMQFYIRNQDVCRGTKHIATLSGNTCLVCGDLDGTVWRIPEELDQVVKLPVHDNCRCVHVPVTDLSEFNSSTRPAEAANYWKEAEIAYNEKYAGTGKNWSRLSRSTKLKYYYQAQRDYEKRTGKPAFDHVSQNMSFKDWLKTKDERYVRQYLGETRFKLYTDGKLPLNKFVNPAPNRAFTLKELKERDRDSFRKAGLV